MLDNFQLTVIVKQGSQILLRYVPLHQALQQSLSENWHTQYEAFTEGTQAIEFNAGYTPEQHECFRIDNFELPPWLATENSQRTPDLEPITNDEKLVASIKSVVAFARDGEGQEVILFQNFSRSHVIQPGRFLLLQNSTYRTIDHPGLTLDGKLSAVFRRGDNHLLFRNFRTVNSFLPLSEFYDEASESEIRDVLDHEFLEAEDPDSLAIGANQWFRKRFAMLRDSSVLDNYSTEAIKRRSRGYDVDIHISHGKLVFPADKVAAKKLLQFLNEELFRGAITETLYETNSKREAD
ncbi:hypothetical protein E2F43_05280 [Seongchinamella unica]|uniref:DUF4868 domain-containing protein n=1 Tax=Seongchinamella unica TaxID=2547392 RepID=A0A4R5LWK3_9GAMM|nr:hypothetical protein [Seongchinamella unica]TDG15638.1 hypothetical protein E2F43_05280 [Seongchinamella unica]